VPRKNPLPETEIAIGRRLAQARKEALIPRAALAVRLGISSNRLYSYEEGLARLPWDVANRVCEILDIGQDWLAGRLTGVYMFFIRIDLSDLPSEQIEKAPFSEVYERYFVARSKKPRSQSLDHAAAMVEQLQSMMTTDEEKKAPPKPEMVALAKKLTAEINRQRQRIFRRPK
jgi:transcriptional regulator with XRE-family HTH domain